MKSRLAIAVSLALILLTGALLAASFHYDLDIRTVVFIACLYAIPGFAVLCACGQDWQVGILLALYGALFGAIEPKFVAGFVLLPACGALLEVVFGPMREEEARDPKADVGLPAGHGILLKNADEVYYQLLRGPDQLLLTILGSRYYGFNPQRAVRDGETFVRGKADRVIEVRDIRGIRIRRDGALRIRARHRERFQIQPATAIDEAAAYLAGLGVEVEEPREPRLSPEGKRAARNAYFAVCVAGGLSAVAWVYLGAPYKLLAGLNIAIPAAAFALLCLFYDAIADVKPYLAKYGWLSPMLPLMLRFDTDYNFDSDLQFVLPCAIFTLCALLFFFALNPRQKITVFLRVALGVAIFSVFIVGHLNFLLDDGTRATEQAGIVLAQVAKNESTFIETHCFLVQTDEYYYSLNGSREVYDAAEKDGPVLVVIHEGPLGINYTEILPAE